MRAYFANAMGALDAHQFWRTAEDKGQYRPEGGLWAPQRRAIAVCAAYLGAWLNDKTRESALVKMPTGTGKTSVIATLACALPLVRRTLIVTPRRALVTQMLADIHWRFWRNFGLGYDGRGLVPATPKRTPTEREGHACGVIRLLPSGARDLIARDTSERVVVVSTFAALEQVLRPDAPAHRLSGKRPRHSYGLAPDRAGPAVDEDLADEVTAHLSDFDLVLVDEGHYEPAFVWSQCIRKLELPTILFSATPYRNDFKFFRVRGNFAFNLGYQEARDKELIRPVQFCNAMDAPAKAGQAGAFVKKLDAFYANAVAGNPWPKNGPEPRVIVRADNYESLVALKDAFKRNLNQTAVLIHENVARNDTTSLDFDSATAALAAPETAGVRYWLHQWKLLEGVDEKQFACIAVYENFGSSRQTIQQIGRVLRFLDFKGTKGEVATIFAAAPILADLQARFERYLKYEEYVNEDPGAALVREARLPSEILKSVAPYQYLFGDFRQRLGLDDDDVLPRLSDFKIPFRASVFRNKRMLGLDEMAIMCRDAMDLEDRFEARVVSPVGKESVHARAIVYLTWSNAEILLRHSMPVWNLGVMVLVAVDNRVFVQDTERFVVDFEKLGFEVEPAENLRRLIPKPTDASRSRVSQASAVGLDLSKEAIRSTSVSKYDLSTGFYDLSQSHQALRNLRAYSYEGKTARSRYLSLDRSSVSDTERAADRENEGIGDFVIWVQSIAAALDSSVEQNRIFDQFAKSVAAPPDSDAQPQNILFDLQELLEGAQEENLGWLPDRVRLLREAELCLDVAPSGALHVPVKGHAPIECKLLYDIGGAVHRKGRYEFESEELDAFVKDPGTAVDEPASLAKLINKEQSFRVVTHAPNLTYANKVFYETSLDIRAIKKGNESGTPLECMTGSSWMQHVKSEKGSGTVDEWVDRSIFGGVYAQFDKPNFGARSILHTARPISKHDPDLAKELAGYSIVVCDDGGKERADFMLVSDNPARVVFVHAKVNDTQFSLNSVQVVGRQALAGLAFMTRGHRDLKRADWWASPWSTDDTPHRLVKHRILVSTENTPVGTWRRIQNALLSSTYTKEIWIWIGKSLSKEAFIKKLIDAHGPKSEALQMVAYLASIQTAAARANVRTRILCSP
ncbi:MAG: DEAD/DEAH box helicase [Piscinibacter sp.]